MVADINQYEDPLGLTQDPTVSDLDSTVDKPFEEPPVDDEFQQPFKEPPYVKSQVPLSETAVDLVSAQLAIINTPFDEEGLDTKVLNSTYQQTSSTLDATTLEEEKEKLSISQTVNIKSMYELEAQALIESGDADLEKLSLGFAYNEQEALKTKELAIEQAFVDRMMDMLAEDEDNLPIVTSIVENIDKSPFAAIIEMNERSLRLSRIISEVKQDQDEQNVFLNWQETVGSLFPAADFFVTLGVKPEDVALGLPGTMNSMLSKRYFEMSSEEYAVFISTYKEKLADATNVGFGANEDLMLQHLYSIQNPHFTGTIKQNTGFIIDILDTAIIAADGINILSKMFNKSSVLPSGVTFRKQTRASQNLALFGQRKLASKVVVDTMRNPGAKGATFEKDVNVASDQAMPSVARNPDYMTNSDVSLADSVVIQSNEKRFNDIVETIFKDERLSSTEKIEAVRRTYDNMRSEFGPSHAVDIRLDKSGVSIGKTEQGKGVTRVNMVLGTEEGHGFPTASAAEASLQARKLPIDAEIFTASDGLHYIKISRDINEKNIKLDLEDISDGFINNWGRSPAATLPNFLFGAAARGGALKGFYFKQMQPLNKTIASLNKKESNNLRSVVTEGNYEAKWYSRTEFDVVHKRLHNNKVPTQKQWEAYRAFINKNDIDHAFLNWSEYVDKKAKGFVTGEVAFENLTLGKVNLREVSNVSDTTRMSIYDTRDDKALSGKSIAVNDVNELLKTGGYTLFEFDNVYRLGRKDGFVNHILVKKGDMRMGNLNLFQVPYRAGGHRSPYANFYLKQARTGAFDKSNRQYILNPLTHAGAPTSKPLEEYAERMNRALDAYQRNQKNVDHPDYLDDAKADNIIRNQNIEKGLKGFKDNVADGLIDTRHPFVVVGKDTPVTPKLDGNEGDVVDLSKVSTITSMLERQNLPYYRGRGSKPLNGPDGERAKLIDPMRLLEQSLSNAVHKGNLANYKFSATTAWFNEFGDSFKAAEGLGKFQTFLKKEVLDERDFFKNLENKVFIQRAINMHHGVRTTLMSHNRDTAMVQRSIEQIGKWSEPRVSSGTSEFIYDLSSKDPLTALRTLNYDAKLGLWAFDQVFAQSSTAISISLLDGPIKAAKYLEWGLAFQQLNFVTSESALNLVSKTITKGQANTADEFKEFVYMGREMGTIELSGDMAELDLTGAFNNTWTISGLRDRARSIVMATERFNKSVGYTKAWFELRKQIDLKDMRKKENTDSLERLASKYSFDMSSIAQARWQKGFLKGPGQFIPYPIKMMTNVFVPPKLGGNPEWSTSERIKMALTQTVLFGAAGTPLALFGISAGAGAMALLSEIGVDTENPEVAALAYGGLVDWAFMNIFDGGIAKRVGIGEGISQLFLKFIGEDFGTSSALDILGGPSGSTLAQFATTIVAPFASSIEVFSALTTDDISDISETAVRDILLKNINSASDVIKAYHIMRYGVYLSSSGQNVAEVEGTMSAIGVMLGLTPTKVLETYRNMGEIQDSRATTNDAAKRLDTHVAEYQRLSDDYMKSKGTDNEAFEALKSKLDTIKVLTKLYPADARSKVFNKMQSFKTLEEYTIDEMFKNMNNYKVGEN